ncbi:MAG: radical SAM family heme chaperone HemW [Saccharofermentanales bacterium]
MEPDLPPRPLGLYIHIPWCISRCAYCVFFSETFSRPAFDEYLLQLQREKNLYRDCIQRELSSVYFGGGTPSLLSAAQINTILEGLPLAVNAEISLEVNPLQVNEAFVNDLLLSPVNRISLGIQSLDDTELSWLTRKHKAADIPHKIQLLKEAGYTNISGDFMYGLPQSKVKDVQANLDRMLQLELTHLSCYLLEIHERGPLAGWISKLPKDSTLAKQYDTICRMATEAGFQQYEISNFARPGYQSRHNLLYWKSDDYLAWGASAAGHFQGIRYMNPASLEEYYGCLTAGDLFPNADQGIHEEMDYIMMRLRLREGLCFSEFKARFGHSFGRNKIVAKLQALGMILVFEDGIRLSDKALFISNSVIGELL